MQLVDNQNVDVALSTTDAAGNPVASTFDAGLTTASFADGSAFTVTTTDSSVNVKANGRLVTGDVLTVSASVSGVALTATLSFDVVAGPAANLVLTPGTPVAN